MNNFVEEVGASLKCLTLGLLYGAFEVGKMCDSLAEKKLEAWYPSIEKVIDRKLKNIEKWLPTV